MNERQLIFEVYKGRVSSLEPPIPPKNAQEYLEWWLEEIKTADIHKCLFMRSGIELIMHDEQATEEDRALAKQIYDITQKKIDYFDSLYNKFALGFKNNALAQQARREVPKPN